MVDAFYPIQNSVQGFLISGSVLGGSSVLGLVLKAGACISKCRWQNCVREEFWSFRCKIVFLGHRVVAICFERENPREMSKAEQIFRNVGTVVIFW